MTYALLNETLVLEIKRRLWSGDTASTLAEKYDVADVTIEKIREGRTWARVAWPNESIGAMPAERKLAIAKARQEAGRESVAKVKRKLREGDEA